MVVRVVYTRAGGPRVINDLLTFADIALKEEMTSSPRAAVLT